MAFHATLIALFMAVILSHAPSAAAQADSLASSTAEFYPYAKHSNGGNDQLQVSTFRISAGFPIFLSKRTMLIPGLSYERLEFTTRSTSGNESLVLQAPTFSLMLVQPLTDRFGVLASVSAGLASDFTSPVTRDDVLLSAMGVVTYKFSDSFSLGTGVTYDRRTGSLAPVPLAIMNWQMSNNMRLRGAIPSTFNFEYRITPWFTSGFRAAFNGNRYHFGEDRFGQARMQIAYSNVAVGPKLVFSANEWVHMEVYAAAAVYRRYDIYLGNDPFIDGTLSPVVGYGVRLWFGPSFWRKPTPTAPPPPD